jgi:hypothetical protein
LKKNLTDFSHKKNGFINLAFYYILSACTLAYVVLPVLGWKMHRFVREHMKGGVNNQQQTLERQRQLTKACF